jgi:hypothetical protein
MGWPSPALAALVGQSFGKRGQKVEKHGFNLVSAQLSGDAWRRGHNEVQDTMLKAFEMVGVDCRPEVANLFAAAMSPEARERWLRAPAKSRRHLIPDFLARMPRQDGDPGGTELGEIKTITPSTSRYMYKASHGDERGAAVNARERAIHTEYEFKAQVADMHYNGCQREKVTECRAAGCNCCDDVGPIRQELRRYTLVGYAVGAYGECSKSMHTLVKRLARAGAHAWQRKLPSASAKGTQGRLGWLIKRRIGMTAVKLNARTLIDRTEHVGMGAEARNARRRARWGHNAQWFTEEARHEHARAREADHGADGAGHTGSYWNFFDGVAGA